MASHALSAISEDDSQSDDDQTNSTEENSVNDVADKRSRSYNKDTAESAPTPIDAGYDALNKINEGVKSFFGWAPAEALVKSRTDITSISVDSIMLDMDFGLRLAAKDRIRTFTKSMDDWANELAESQEASRSSMEDLESPVEIRSASTDNEPFETKGEAAATAATADTVIHGALQNKVEVLEPQREAHCDKKGRGKDSRGKRAGPTSPSAFLNKWFPKTSSSAKSKPRKRSGDDSFSTSNVAEEVRQGPSLSFESQEDLERTSFSEDVDEDPSVIERTPDSIEGNSSTFGGISGSLSSSHPTASPDKDFTNGQQSPRRRIQRRTIGAGVTKLQAIDDDQPEKNVKSPKTARSQGPKKKPKSKGFVKKGKKPVKAAE